MKYISFSLYGKFPKYCVGACKNAVLAKHWYPDYKCIFWVDDSVPEDVVSYLKWSGAIVRNVSHETRLAMGGMFWRFLINDEPNCERYLIRDADSRIGERDVVATREWEASGRAFHIVRDHPHHNVAILGGAWGAMRGAVPNMRKLIDEWTGLKEGYDADQQFLYRSVFPLVESSSLQHDSALRHKWPNGDYNPSPFSYENPRFICEVFDAYDRPRSYDWEKILMMVADHPVNKRSLFIRTHLGLGDAFIQNSLVRSLCLTHDRVIYPVKRENIDTLSDLWSDVKNLDMLPVCSDSEADKEMLVHAGQCLRLGMFSDNWADCQTNWDKFLYDQAKVSFSKRWDFKIGRMPIQHKLSTSKPFAVLHEDINRGFVVPRNRKPTLPTVSIWPSKSLLEFIWMLQNASEIHCIDSSVAILADSIPTSAEQLVLHLYARPGAKPPTYKKPWKILVE